MSTGGCAGERRGTPSSSRAGRRFAQRSSPWRSGSSRPQSVTWSGTDGSPTAPSSMASMPRATSSASGGHHRAVSRGSGACPRGGRSTSSVERRVASTALRASATTSGPAPSPAITAIAVRHREPPSSVGIAERPSSARHESGGARRSRTRARRRGRRRRDECASSAPWKTSPAPSVLTTRRPVGAGASNVSPSACDAVLPLAPRRHDHELGAGGERGLGRAEVARRGAACRRRVQRHTREVEPVDRVAAVDREADVARGAPRSRRGRRAPRPRRGMSSSARSAGSRRRGTREVDDRAAVAADEDRALRRAGAGDAARARRRRRPRARARRGSAVPTSSSPTAPTKDVSTPSRASVTAAVAAGPAAGDDELRRDDAVVRRRDAAARRRSCRAWRARCRRRASTHDHRHDLVRPVRDDDRAARRPRARRRRPRARSRGCAEANGQREPNARDAARAVRLVEPEHDRVGVLGRA